jgi:acetyl-CoA carboxylase biotin carboxylase subunit
MELCKKILIANRGDVALRVLRACQELGIETVAVHSTADSDSMHVRLADEAVCIGPPQSRDSYLSMAAILTAAEITNADAVHPGVGFLSESATFAEMVQNHGRLFIGPSPQIIATMGDKVKAKEAARQVGIPVVPGSEGAISSLEEARQIAQSIGYPILVKAASGGGGRGMKVAQSEAELETALSMASSEAKAAFGDDAVYLEKYLANPRHIEIQVLGDKHGNIIHLGERDCSVQRRHQKILEEAPSPALDAAKRSEIGRLTAEAVGRLGYDSVGTVEYLYENGEFYFIEMNTRLQVEHPVTELVTGIDLVRKQIRVAAGQPLDIRQEDIRFTGHAIECRINAEHPLTFMPSPGRITQYHMPGGPGVRVDSHLYTGYTIPPYYDSLAAKLLVHARNRPEAIRRMQRALREMIVEGIHTNQPLHTLLFEQESIQKGDYTIRWLESFLADRAAEESS